jgi:hypothetical protein
LSGFAGWSVLKRTMPTQQAAFQANTAMQRDTAYFRDKIGKIDTAEQLVSDRRLLRVALGAFGLDNDINNTFFIRKVLEDGSLKEGALANRLADKQYLKFSAAFGFGDFKIPRSKLSDFADKTLDLYRTRQFEGAVGEQNDTYRLALNAERELPLLSRRDISEEAKWFTIMGNAPLREVVQTALGLPKSFTSLDLDKQLNVFRNRANSNFGSSDPKQFGDPKTMEKLVRTFLLRAELANSSPTASSSSLALQLLRR